MSESSRKLHAPSPVRGRWAPSPTGMLHLGNVRTALVAWLSVRSRGGRLVYRLEDLDSARVLPGVARLQMEDLRWLGLDWDEGLVNDSSEPDEAGDYGPYRQSERHALYEETLRELDRQGRIFACTRSRREIREASGALDGETAIYPRRFRPTEALAPRWLDDALETGRRDPPAIRLKVDPQVIQYRDELFGSASEDVAQSVGDYVLRRRDAEWAYQLAVVCDDVAMEITEVVRGCDLLDSTARQILLTELLGGSRAGYLHVPLVLNEQGDKLSKRDGSLEVRALREAGVGADVLVGYLGWSLGLVSTPRPLRARELVEWFRLERLRCEACVLPADFGSLVSQDPSLAADRTRFVASESVTGRVMD